MIRLEVCVDDPAGLAEAIAGGADRIELCAALSLGGLTPPPGLITAAAESPVPVFAMIRPRSGDFVFSPAEVRAMRADIRAMRDAGLAGVVLGANRADGTLDAAVLSDLLAEAAGMEATLHRAIDLTPDPEAAVETAVALGFGRILTSGGQARAHEGADVLARMFRAAAGRLIVMPGSGVTPETVPALAALPLREVHASCAIPLPAGGRPLAMGFQTGTEKRTDRHRVAALKAALSSLRPRAD